MKTKKKDPETVMTFLKEKGHGDISVGLNKDGEREVRVNGQPGRGKVSLTPEKLKEIMTLLFAILKEGEVNA